jgi:Double-GTPase 2
MAETMKCSKAGCRVAETGSCAEGHTPLLSCPNFGAEAEEEEESYDGELGDEGTSASVAELVMLPQGEALTLEEVDQLLRWRGATFVTVIGDSHSGKTTLICALYDRFLRGPFAGLTFVGSRTLVALERRSHYARVDSGRVTPETARTTISDGLRYFHLSVAGEQRQVGRVDLLLSDRAGEVYRQARNDSSVVSTLEEIPRADRLVLLLDGGRVVDPFERNGALQSVRQTLRALLDNDAVNANSIVQVVTTKVDLITRDGDAAAVKAALAEFRKRLVSDFGVRLRSLTFHDIAARDPNGEFQPAHGIDALIEDWTTPTGRHIEPALPISVSLESEFDRLLIRTPIE